MSVDDWARREAEKRNLRDQFGFREIDRAAFAHGIVYAFDALLSEEAWDFLSEWNDEEDESLTRAQAIRLVQAAVRAVTEGESE